MSQKDAGEALKLLMGLERLARLAETIPDEVLVAWIYYDTGITKRKAREVVNSIKKLTEILTKKVSEQ